MGKLNDSFDVSKEGVKDLNQISNKLSKIPVLPTENPEEIEKFGKKVVKLSKKFWNFLKQDSWQSLLVSLVIAFLLIKFVLFPTLTILTGSALPLVIVESCSMYHSTSMEDVMQNKIYADVGVSFNDSENWMFQHGIKKGDIIFVVKPTNLKVGDVIIFNGGLSNPIIHRIIRITPDGKITTKGDHNAGLLQQELTISQEQLVGKAVFRVPYIGWAKLVFFDWMNSYEARGLCE